MNVKDLTSKYKQYVIEMRREFHMYPESSLKEVRTSQRIREELEKTGIPHESVADTGVVGIIRGKMNGKTIALRGDIDALELEELNDLDYKSKNKGLMHGCGHDGHAAMLLGAAKVLNEIKNELKGTVLLFFQPGEEVALGAKKMIEEGVLEGVDGIFGAHLWSGLPCGTVSVEAGPRLASADRFKIKVTGQGGHGSRPHETVDAVMAASAIVMNLQSIVSRELDPLDSVVVSIGSLHAGTRFNIIAGEAVMEGTSRYFSPQMSKSLPEVMERIIHNTAKCFRAKAELEYYHMVSPTINDEFSSQIAEDALEKLFGKESIAKQDKFMGGEDFSLFSEKVPGVYAWIGAQDSAKGANYPHHHGNFNIDEDALAVGTALYAQYAIDFLMLPD